METYGKKRHDTPGQKDHQIRSRRLQSTRTKLRRRDHTTTTTGKTRGRSIMNDEELLNKPVKELTPEQLQKGIKTIQKDLKEEATQA